MGTKTLDDFNFEGKRALVRVDFNVPMQDGKVSDVTRLARSAPTIQELADKGAKLVLLSHFGRPKGSPVPDMSLAPVVDALRDLLGRDVVFGRDCIGEEAARAVAATNFGGICLLENTRFHPGEEKNDPDFAKALSANGDIFVGDAFSTAHRAHASNVGVAAFLPACAGRAMEREVDYLTQSMANPERPMMAVVGGAKVSSKLAVLENLVTKADYLVVGGGMANTFLHAMGIDVGKSLCEPDLAPIVQKILSKAAEAKCEVVLPCDVVVATEFKAHAESRVRPADKTAADEMILDLGPDSVDLIAGKMENCKTLVWNGPLGAFETPPFDTATIEAAKYAGKLAKAGRLVAVAGGGDTVAALNHAKAADDFTYISTAGGAFLEWMEGKALPGVEVLKSK